MLNMKLMDQDQSGILRRDTWLISDIQMSTPRSTYVIKRMLSPNSTPKVSTFSVNKDKIIVC